MSQSAGATDQLGQLVSNWKISTNLAVNSGLGGLIAMMADN